MKAVETILGDCLEVLADIPSDSVDAVLTDPPYGTASASKVVKLETFNHSWDQSLPLEYLDECARVLKPGGSLVTFTDNKRLETVWNHVESTGLRPLQTFYWLKTNPPPQPRKNFQSAVETAVFARKAGKIIHWGGGGASKNYIETAIAMGNDRTAHPTQKHVEVFQYLIRALCPQGGIVLDPFGGSGTTGVAALLEGRRALLIEKSPEYFKIMNERLIEWQQSDRVRQFQLFGG
jgi:DNA modification methylase